MANTHAPRNTVPLPPAERLPEFSPPQHLPKGGETALLAGLALLLLLGSVAVLTFFAGISTASLVFWAVPDMTVLVPGTPVSDTLSAGGIRTYTLEMQPGMNYVLELECRGCEANFFVLNRYGQRHYSSGGYGSGKASLTLPPMISGLYRVIVQSTDGRTGSFELRVQQQEIALVSGKTGGGPGSPAVPGIPGGGTIVQTFEDKLLRGGMQTHNITLDAGTLYCFDMESTEFDCWLELYEDATGALLAQNDDGGTGLNSRITHTPTRGGVYRVVAKSFANGGGGQYRIIVRR